ncbi:MAG: cellobiose phosphorylase [Lachnospiraceae bacterium]|nr:cellobiose phosphorylase [Lachnospiraceae bacterium]
MSNYRFENNTFMIDNYDQVAPFSSFLPGIAGVKGIPLWCFYTNRGQGVNSFGVHDKSHAIMEFNPAVTAYENTPVKGFRTFIKVNGKVHEPFAGYENDHKRTFFIRENCFWIEDFNEETGIKTQVKYFLMPCESYGALVRNVTITNESNADMDLEVLDGIAKIIPYGIQNSGFKEMANLFRSWTDLKNLDHNIPIYNMRASAEDKAEADSEEIKEGYFYLSFIDNKIVAPIYDNDIIFGQDSSLVTPVYFKQHALSEIKAYDQVFANRIPSGFTPFEGKVKAGESIRIHTLIGMTNSSDEINRLSERIIAPGYLEQKEEEALKLVAQYTADVKTHTSNPLFDQYIEQCYLDNFLRGGYPFIFPQKEGSNKVVHLFSRKHGDPERDYNFFSTAGEYYSQGNGNFRDVNQNRRNDVFFHPEVGDFNVKTFFSLVQADGYNPLEIRPSTFTILPEKKDALEALLSKAAKNDADKKVLAGFVAEKFTFGQVINGIFRKELSLSMDEDDFLQELSELCEQNIEAGFGEGYWSDHFDYNFDLVEDFLKIYPDMKENLLYNNRTYRFYDSPERVMPRSEKYVVTKGVVRQYGALQKDTEKLEREDYDAKGTNWLKDEHGNIVEVSLFTKMLFLAAIKFATLDPEGMGIEMEGGKPGWNDATNGLPGLVGSGMSETMELERIVSFLKSDMDMNRSYTLPEEIAEFIRATATQLKAFKEGKIDQFTYWDTVACAREDYRARVQHTMTGKETELSATEINEYLELAHDKLLNGIRKAKEFGNGLMPTYIAYDADDFEIRKDADGNEVNTHYGLPAADVKHFTPVHLPAFLEGPAKYLKTLNDVEEATDLYKAVKGSKIYDAKIKMYKTSEPLDAMGMDFGRIRAFTPGWQERESVFLHMAYKYQLGILKAGLYDEFYKEMKNVLIPFLDPAVYGRSTLENSSFIASGLNPDPSTHGRGFVARLSGSTTEVLSMWTTMMAGDHPFTMEDGDLAFSLQPALAGWLFDENGEVSFQMCSETKVTYCNAARKNTYGADGVKVVDMKIDGTSYGTKLTGEMADKVRKGKIKEIICELG